MSRQSPTERLSDLRQAAATNSLPIGDLLAELSGLIRRLLAEWWSLPITGWSTGRISRSEEFLALDSDLRAELLSTLRKLDAIRDDERAASEEDTSAALAVAAGIADLLG